MIGCGLIRLCIVVFLFCPALYGQVKHLVKTNDEVDICLVRYFRPVMISVPDTIGGVRLIRCSDSNSRICDVSGGISQSNSDGIKCLVNAGYDFNVESGKYTSDYVPLFRAAFHDDQILKLIFESKIPINLEVKDKLGRTALEFIGSLSSGGLVDYRKPFSWERIYKSLELLLEKGASPDATADGITPLMFQVGSGRSRFVELLLRFKANPNLQSEEGETALMRSADDPQKIKLLLDANADIYLKDKDGNSAIFHALKECQVNKIVALLKKDERILESVDNRGITALTYLKKRSSSTDCRTLKGLIPVKG